MLSRKHKILLCIIVGISQIEYGALLSLTPAFYPTVAESIGATASQYGFVFGISNLAGFIAGPVFGKFGNRIGVHWMLKLGSLIQGIAGALFGFLVYITDTTLFIALSYLLRFLHGVSSVAAWASVNTMLIFIFPKDASKVVASIEVLQGLGYMIGPMLGSLIYEYGGFLATFLSTGLVGIVLSVLLIVVIPTGKYDKLDDENYNDRDKCPTSTLGLTDIFKSPKILFPFVDNMICFVGTGMMEAMLEPYMINEVYGTHIDVGITFMIYALTYIIGSLIAGQLCKTSGYAMMASVIGNGMMGIAFTFFGPVPFIPINPKPWLIQVAIAVTGVAYSFVMVSTFVRARLEVIKEGYRDSIETNLLISSMWSASFYLGNFLGPTIGGLLVDYFDFPWTAFTFSIVYIIMTFIDFGIGITSSKKTILYIN